jgi:hypothetical protein
MFLCFGMNAEAVVIKMTFCFESGLKPAATWLMCDWIVGCFIPLLRGVGVCCILILVFVVCFL